MKRFYMLLFGLLLTLGFSSVLPAQVVWLEDFETDGQGVRYLSPNLFIDPTSTNDYWGRIDGTAMTYADPAAPGSVIAIIGQGSSANQIGIYSGFSGTHYFAGEDLDDVGGLGSPDGENEKEIFFPEITISGYTSLQFTGLFAAGAENPCSANQYDQPDFVRIFYSVDGGPEVQALCFSPFLFCAPGGDNLDEPFYSDPDLDGNGSDGIPMLNAFQEFNFTIPDGVQVDIRVVVHMDGDGEEIAFDYFRITGTPDNCVDPVISAVNKSGDIDCQNPGPVVLEVEGDLNDATQWVWYETACGDGPIGQGTNISVNPGSTTTYYVRGEPACDQPLPCQSITVEVAEDDTPPVVTCGGNTLLPGNTDCEGVLPDYAGQSSATDDCDIDPVITQSPAAGTLITGSTTVTVSATDLSGNVGTCTLTILVEDDTPPTLSVPADASLFCGDNQAPPTVTCGPVPVLKNVLVLNLPASGVAVVPATAFDAGSMNGCGAGNLNFSFTANTGNTTKTFDCNDIGDNPVTLWLTDGNGNKRTATVTLRVQDNGNACAGASGCTPLVIAKEDLIITLPEGSDRTLQAAELNNGSVNTCSAPGQLTYSFSSNTSDQTRIFGCDDLGAQSLELWATDGNGNQSRVITTVVVQDELDFCNLNLPCAPTGTLHHTLVVNLPPSRSITVPASLFDAGSANICENTPLGFYFLNPTPVSALTFTCANIGANTLTVRFTDDSHTSVGIVTLIVQDNQNACQGPGFAFATDNCDPNPVIAFTDAVTTGDCPAVEVITRTWTATDDAGNTSSLEQIIYIEDQEPPTVVCPDNQFGNYSVNCDFTLPDYSSLLIAGDDCNGDLIITQSPAAGQSITANSTITLTVADACGNETPCSFSVELEDINPPALNCPGNQSGLINLDCEFVIPDYTPLAIPDDNCDPVVSISQFPTPGTVVTATTPIVFTATDSEGNTATCSFDVVIADGAPVFSLTPDPITVGCSDDVPGEQGVEAFDGCDGEIQVFFTQTGLPLVCPGEGTIVNTWTATDSQGNTVTHIQMVTVANTQGPVFSTLPQNMTVGCLEDVPGNPGVTATSACGDPVAVVFLQSPLPACEGIVTNTWIAQDCSGASAVHTQTITIDDTELPQFSETVQNTSVNCFGDVPGDPGITALDDCGNEIEVVFSQSGPAGCAGTGTVVNTWTAIDCAGNTAVMTQEVTIQDNTPPVFSAAVQDMLISCSNDAPGNQGVTAVDDCDGPVSVTFTQSPMPACSGSGLVVNTWTATDCAGNTATMVQEITIDDIHPPVFTSTPNSITVSCVSDIPSIPPIEAIDECDGAVPVTFTQSGNPACPGEGSITLTWVATDCAGNTATHTQLITIDDNTPPSFSATPANITVSCTANVPGGQGITAVDNCGQSIPVQFSQTAVPGCEGQVTNTWTATDCAGNTATYSQTVTVNDNTPPALSAQPVSLTVSCVANVPGNQGVTATDNCGQSIPVSFTQTPLPGCEGAVTNTWTATDCAGNTASYSQTVTVNDNTPPVLSALPANLVVDCEDDVPGGQGVTATDNCGGSLPVQFNQTINGSSVTNTWTAVDCAGNSATHSQEVTVEDDTAPVALCQNAQVSLNANGSLSIFPALIDNGSYDNCEISEYLISVDELDCDNVGVQQVTLTVRDENLNESSCSANVQVTASAACPIPSISNYGGPNISDPCTCLSDGKFAEQVVVGPSGAGQAWKVVSTTLINPNTNQPFAPNTLLTEVPQGGGQSLYVISGIHLDGLGYTITVSSPYYPGQTLSISNTCYYPDPVITGLDGPYCLSSPDVVLEGNAGGVFLESEGFTVDGVPATVFDPSDAGIGNHTIVYTVNAGTAGSNDPADPGCVASVSEIVQVIETPASMACNNGLTIAVDENCEALITPDMILEGTYGCYDDYEVTVKWLFLTLPNPVPGDYIGLTLTITVTHIPSGNSCWGSATLEDNLAPTFNCPTAPIEIVCSADFDNVPPPVATDNCTGVTVSLVNEVIIDDDPCDGDPAEIHRIWIASDTYGNESETCTQIIYINRPDIVDFPNDITWECTQYEAYPNIALPEALHPAIESLQNGTDPIDATGVTNPSVLGNTGSGIPEGLEGTYCNYGYTFVDQIIETCGSTFKIIRIWTVLDWCTGQIVTSNVNGEDNIQVIKIVDSTPPTASLDPFEVSANIPGVHPNPCRSQDFLPPPVFSDNCHDVTVFIYTPIGEAIYVNGINGNNGGIIPAPGLTLGVHQVHYQVIDECGNTTDLYVPVSVVDDITPTAICDEITQVSLSSDGQAVVPASIFDDGSFDNCCLDDFEVRRMDGDCEGNFDDFGPTVTFCCSDIGDTVMVVFRVYDCFDNYNECMVQALVEDKLNPIVLTCPPNQEIDCNTYLENYAAGVSQGDYTVLEVFGAASFYDNCEFEVAETVAVNLDNCTQGTIVRTWQAEDPSGNLSPVCTQTITVNHVSDFVVEFPANLTAECVDGQIPPFGEPEIFFDECELVATSFDDQLFEVVPDACYKIVRTWIVINWCLYEDYDSNVFIEFSESQVNQDFDGDGDKDNRTFKDGVNDGNGPDGYIMFNQVIKVEDTEAPIFTVEDLDVCIEETDCNTDVTLPTPDVTDCSTEVDITITSNLPNGSGFGPYLNVPVGAYTATYAVTDNCGNTSYETIEITVEDCKKPTPYCQTLIIEIMQTGMIMVEADDFDAGSFDNCPGPLKFSFSPDVNDVTKVFTCDELGAQSIQIWVTDASGNQDFCVTTLTVQDNMGVCSGNFTIAGVIARENTTTVAGVMVDINGGLTNMMTPPDGGFYFQLPAGGDYSVTPMLDTLPANGVTTLDMVLIQKHILDLQLLDSPYKIIAADANNTASVTTLDMVVIQKLILGLITEFPNNTSWRFVDQDFVFTSPQQPWLTPFPEVINFNNLAQDQLFTDFVAVKVGDVNLTADVSGTLSQVDDRQWPNALIFEIDEQEVKAGQTITLPFRLQPVAVHGFQFTLDFDAQALELVDIRTGRLQPENFGTAFTDQGAITMAWGEAYPRTFGEEPVFELVFRTKQAGPVSQWLNIGSRFTPEEAYDENTGFLDVQLQVIGSAVAPGFALYQNVPNPFYRQTVIGFTLPEAGDARLTVFDPSGKVVYLQDGTFAKGYNEILVKDLAVKGLVYYQLSSEHGTLMRRMVVE